MERLRSAAHSVALTRPIYVWTGVGLLGAAAYLVWLARQMNTQPYDVWGGLVVGPVLLAISLPLIFRITRKTNDGAMTGVLVAALVFKLGGALVRYFVTRDVYGGSDAETYNDWGAVLAPIFRSGDFTVDIGSRVVGTGFVKILTGWVYVFTGPTVVGGYLVFSLLGFWGLFLFYRAFRIAFPAGDARRYALLLFFMPSMMFWSSSIGKEAWMTFALGVTAYGLARLLAYQRGGLPVLILGMLGTAMVRPHVTLIVFLAVAAAYIMRPPERRSLVSPLAKVGGLVILAVVGLVVLSQVQSFFGVSKLNEGAVDGVFQRASDQSSQGGSQFEAIQPGSPLGYGLAVVSVLFRPWPFEASNMQALFASLEGVVLVIISALSFRRLASVPRTMVRVPYVVFAVVFSMLFIYAFANIGNFGIIVRQRVQLYPFVFVLLAVPVVARSAASRRAARAHPSPSSTPGKVPAPA